MQNRKKKTGAKIAKVQEDTFGTSVNVEINGYLYSAHGSTRVESIVEAVEAHIGEDREFKSNITVIQKGYVNEIVYAPAVLCMLGYIDKGDLYSLLVRENVEEDPHEFD